MRFCVLGSLVLSALAVQIPTALHAQFQEPTKEELQMTEDAKAPGAAAVFLDVDFYQKVAAVDQQQLVFMLSATSAKGN